MNTIYVGNLPVEATEEDISQLFGLHGQVTKVSLIADRETGRPRGFGFVEMDVKSVPTAVDALDGTEFKGHTLRVNEARDRGARPPRRSW